MQNQEQIRAKLSTVISQLKNNAIPQLDLSSSQLGDAGIQALSTALKGNRTLTTLNVYNNQISDAGVQTLSSLTLKTPF